MSVGIGSVLEHDWAGRVCDSVCENINPLTTNDDYSRHRNSAACYQLAQSVLKMGQGEVGGCHRCG